MSLIYLFLCMQYWHTPRGNTSSTSFDLFIDELSDPLLENCGSGISITNDIPDIFCLIFADEVAGCAETAIKLQQQNHVTDSFCCDTGMEINMDKTEITVFPNGGPLRRYKHMGGIHKAP